MRSVIVASLSSFARQIYYLKRCRASQGHFLNSEVVT